MGSATSTQSARAARSLQGLGKLAQWRQAWLGMDTNPRVLALAQTCYGKILIYAGFVLALLAGRQLSLAASALIALTVAACIAAPHRKLIVMAVSGTVYFCLRPYRTQQQIEFSERVYPPEFAMAELPALASYTPLAIAFLAVFYVVGRLASRYPRALPVRRSFISQTVVFFALLVVGGALSPATASYGLIWSLIVMIAASFFFLAYGMADIRGQGDVRTAIHVGFVRPFWSGPSIPFKGLSYLRKFEAHEPAELAAVRLRALKLIVWATMLACVCRMLEAGAYDMAGLPTLQQAIADTAGASSYGIALSWTVLIKAFLLNVISLGALVHTLVAVIRVCGYGIPRGMARPLTARSIAEFWNRYLFYFKELLVDFFFYPAFVRFFKKWPRLRIAFATFCAAFVGNMIFSILSQAHLFADIGPLKTLAMFDSYAVYALALTVALIASQLASRRPRPEDGVLRYEILPRVTVIGFFCVAQIFSDEGAHTSLAERTGFLLHLLGA